MILMIFLFHIGEIPNPLGTRPWLETQLRFKDFGDLLFKNQMKNALISIWLVTLSPREQRNIG